MSGGVGPPCDITLPKDDQPADPSTAAAAGKPPTRRNTSFFILRQLNTVVIAVVLSASGMVCAQDFAFVVFSILYMYFISRVAFPPTATRSESVFGDRNTFLSIYTFAGGVIGLLLPIAYIFEGVFEGDKEGIKAAAPHVFLLAGQFFVEGVASTDRFSLPARVLVPVVYNSMRILSILEWLRSEMSKEEAGFGGGAGGRRLYVGRALAVANMAYWSFNLFGFLLPFYLPKAFKMYYTKVKD